MFPICTPNINPGKDGISPVSRIRGLYEQVRKENPYTLFTNSGDDYEKGSLAEELSRGRTTKEIVHALKYDVRTLGNHDFACGGSKNCSGSAMTLLPLCWQAISG